MQLVGITAGAVWHTVIVNHMKVEESYNLQFSWNEKEIKTSNVGLHNLALIHFPIHPIVPQLALLI